MQNFGLFRIWDARLNNDPLAGRNLDRWLAHALYIAPILAGPSLHKTLESLNGFSSIGWDLPSQLFQQISPWQSLTTGFVVIVSALFIVYYVWSYQRLARAGYQISRQKIVFVFSLGFTSILAWGFLPPLEAFFVANFFHNLQYFGIVWWIEKRNIRRAFGLSRFHSGEKIALVAFLLSLWLLAVGTEAGSRSNLHFALALGLVVALLHFWYDGFIWSVRKQEVDPA
jgi:hypothetical protein